jgi:hypothetical protein
MRLLGWLGTLLKRVPPGRSERRARPYRDRFVPALQVTRLEPRCVLNAAPIPAPVAPPPPHATPSSGGATNPNVLVVAAADMLNHPPQSPQDANVVRLVRDGANVDVFVNGAEIESVPLSDIGAIDVQGMAGPETLIIDYSGGNPLPAGGLIFEASTATAAVDTLVIEGGSAQTVNVTMGPAGSGSVAIDGTVVSFAGVQSVVDTLDATTLDVALADGGQTWSLGDGPQPGALMLASSGGTQMTLDDPTGALVIDASAAGTNPGDTLQIGDVVLSSGAAFSVLGRASDTVNVTGDVQVGSGGVVISSGTETLSGTIAASGGPVTLTATSAVTISPSGVIRDAGGTIVIDAGPSGTLLDFGVIDASSTAGGTTGGTVDLLGEYVGLSGQAVVNVSGSAGGGAVRIGGDFHGSNPALENAAKTYVGGNVTITADALDSGDGGTIVVWSDQATMYYGQINARGGAAGGNGGNVEISSAANLAEQGLVNLSAPHGQVGSLLLDPQMIHIVHGSTGGNDTSLPSIMFNTGSGTFTVSDSAISDPNQTADITLEATQSITADQGVTVTLHNDQSLIIKTENKNGNAGNIDLGNASFSISGTGSITIEGSMDGHATGNVTVGNLSVANGDISISTRNGTVTVTGAVSAGGDGNTTGVVRLQATGDVTEHGSGAVTASSLGAATTGGNITLAGNNSVGTFAASDKVTGGSITFIDTPPSATGMLVVGDVMADSNIGFVDTPGIVTNHGNVSLKSTAALKVDNAINAGNLITSGDVRLLAAGDITESGNGTISGSRLGAITSSGSIALTGNNSVGTFAASDTSPGGSITFNDTPLPATGVLMVGSITEDETIGFAVTTGFLAGVTASNGNISLDSMTGGLKVDQAINAGSGGNAIVLLQAAGDITQSGCGTITGSALGATTTSGNITLDQNNSVGTFAANDTDPSGGSITFNDNTALNIGTVTLGNTTVDGVSTTGNGSILLEAQGDVTQSAAITSSALGVTTTAGNIVLASSKNSVTTFAGNDTASSGGSITFNDSTDLTIGNVTVGSGSSSISVSGVSTTNGNISLQSGGLLDVTEAITAGSSGNGGVVLLQAGGNVTQSAAITASALGVTTTAGNIALTLGNNSVGTFAASDTAPSSSGGSISFRDNTALTIGDLASAGPTGVTTTNGDILLRTTGNLTISAAVAAANGTVALVSSGGKIAWSSGTVQAQNLLLKAPNGIGAAGAAVNVNVSGNLAAAVTGNSATGDIFIIAQVPGAGNLTIGTVTEGSGNSSISVTGVTTTNGNIALGTTTGTLTVTQPITAASSGNGGIVLLQAAGGISESGCGTISASSLGATTTSGNIILAGTNSVSTFAAKDTASGGSITFHDTTDLTIGAVPSLGNQFLGATGVSGGIVELQAGGNVTQSASITASELSVTTTAGNITLTNGNNSVGTFAGNDSFAGGSITFHDNADLTIGTVAGVSGNGPVVMTSNGTISLEATGNLTVLGNVSSGGGAVDLEAFGNLSVGSPGTPTTIDSGVGTILLRADSNPNLAGTGNGIVSIGSGATVNSSNPTAAAITLQGDDLNIATGAQIKATGQPNSAMGQPGGGVQLFTSTGSAPMAIGAVSPTSGTFTVTQAELASIVDADVITIGQAVVQTGNITFSAVTLPSDTGEMSAGLQVYPDLIVNQTGLGTITLIAGATAPALNAGSGNITLNAGSGGIVAINGNSGFADLQTTGTSVTLITTGPIGAMGNPILFADSTNAAQEVVNIGTTLIQEASPVFVSGLRNLTLGNVSLNGGNLTATAVGDLNVVGTVTTGNGTILLRSDFNGTGAGVVKIDAGATVSSSNPTAAAITLQGADLNIAVDAQIEATGQPNSAMGQPGGGVQFFTSTGSAPMAIGAATPTTGTFTVTQAELASIVDAHVITIGQAGVQTGNITFNAVIVPPDVDINAPPVFPDLVVNQIGAGQVTVAGILTVAGNVVITADNVVINNNIFAGNSTTPRAITIENATPLRTIDLGGNSATSPTSLSLTSNELSLLNASVVRIGRDDKLSGTITVSGAVTLGANTTNAANTTLHLFTGGDVVGSGSIDVTNLAISAGGSVSLSGPNAVSTLAGKSSGSSFTFTDTDPLSIGTVDNVAGINAAAGNVTLTSSSEISQTAPIIAGLLTGNAGTSIALSDSRNNVAAVQLFAGGDIIYTAAGNVAILQLATAGTAIINANGSIFGGNPLRNGIIMAGQLQLSAGVGIGTAGSPLLTDVKSVEASAGTGGVHLVNFSSLTIGTSSLANSVAGGLNGITATGGGIDVFALGSLTLAGPVALTGAGTITLAARNQMNVNSAVTNGSGDIVLESQSDVNLQRGGTIVAGGNIMITAGHDFNVSPRTGNTGNTGNTALTDALQTTNGTVTIIVGNTANIIQPNGQLSQIPPVTGFLIETGTGFTEAAPPYLRAIVENVAPGVAISVDGTVTVAVTFGRPNETNFTVTVNWGDGTSSTFTSMTPGMHVFTHTYSLASIQANTIGGSPSQLGGTTAFSLVVSVRGDPRVAFFLGGQSLAVSQQTVPLISPGLGLAGTDLKSFGSPPAATFATPEFRAVLQGAGLALPPGQSSFAANQTSPGGATAAGTDRLLLRMVSADESEKEDPANDIDIKEDPNFNINEVTTASLKALFARLPDGRYRIVWHRGSGTGDATERVILDVLLRDGKPINFDDLEKPSVPLKNPDVPAPEPLSPPAADAPAEAQLARPPAARMPLEPARVVLASAAASDLLRAASAPVVELADRPAGIDGAPVEEDRRAAGALLIPAAALVEMALLRKRWSDDRDSLPAGARGGGALTRAARLYRRLRRGSGQAPLSSNSTGRSAS